MDNLSSQAGESQLRLHDSCFDRCVSSFTASKLDKTEETCVQNCFKSFAHSFKISQGAIQAFYDTPKAVAHLPQ